MEYHAVPPEERAKDAKGNDLPWAYVSKDDLRNFKRPPEETGPFGKKRSSRLASVRSGTRTVTPAARRENPNVAEFTRLFTQQQEKERKESQVEAASPKEKKKEASDKVATECILYGYRNKDVEWKAIDKYEKISGGLICEDYPRTDPDIKPGFSHASAADIVIRSNLSPDANRKSKRYDGGLHWIKVTFESAQAAEQACHYSPQVIDNYLVYCELYHGHGPKEDAPIPKDGALPPSPLKPEPKTTVETTKPLELPAFPQFSDIKYPTISTTENTGDVEMKDSTEQESSIRQRHIPSSNAIPPDTAHPPQSTSVAPIPGPSPSAEGFSTVIPGARLATLRPISDALPPQPSMIERVLRSIPGLNWLTGDIVGDGPAIKEDGSFDYEKSSAYWRIWYLVDQFLGTDLCGMRD